MADSRRLAAGAAAGASEVNACLLARFAGPTPPPWLRRWLADGLGGVLLFAGNIEGPEQLRELAGELRAVSPDVLIAVDEEGGIVTRVEAVTGSSHPGNAALGAIDDVGLTRQSAASIGAMLADAGINLDLAPVADVNSNPANPVIGVRSFGASPAVVAAHTAAFVAGLQECRVAACAKHFPGHGRADADSHLELPVVDTSLAELRAADLLPFAAAIEAGVQSVMTAHVVFPAVDDSPATLSYRFLTEILRHDLGFHGVVITDALGMAAIGDSSVSARGAVRSVAAGADLVCLPADPGAQAMARDTLATAVRDGELPRSRVTQAAARVRALADWARPARPARPAVPDAQIGRLAARRALLIDLDAVPLPAPPFVLDAGGRMSSQLDDSAASLLGLLRERMPGTDGVRLSGPQDEPAAPELAALLARAAGRPLVVVVCDAHRRSWQRDLLARALAARQDAIVVGTGTVHDRALAGRSYLGSRGAGRANLTAAADLLAGRGPAR